MRNKTRKSRFLHAFVLHTGCFLIFISTLASFCGISFASDFPEQSNFVTDATTTLSDETVANLNLKLKNYEAKTGTEIAVVIVNSTDEMPIWQFATELGNAWKVGKKDVNNGALLVVAIVDRELFIATGSQLEGALTDIESKEIIDKVITPQFKNENFDDGITMGVEGMILAIAGESFTNLRMESSNSLESFANILFILVFFIFPWFAAILGRSKKIWPGGAVGAIGGGISGLLFNFAVIGIVAATVGLGIFGLIFDFIVSRNFAAAKKSNRRVAWWAGGERRNFGKSGFGGFGGGGFSGGGAGGRW